MSVSPFQKTIGDTWVVARTGQLIDAEVDGEVVALDVESGTCFGFNQTASRVWRLLEEPRPFGGIVDALVVEYGVDRTQCREEVCALLRDLHSDRLVELRDPDR